MCMPSHPPGEVATVSAILAGRHRPVAGSGLVLAARIGSAAKSDRFGFILRMACDDQATRMG